MREYRLDLWNCPAFGFCITTNGTVKPDGRVVMGRGNALEAKQRIPGIDKILGLGIKAVGNHVQPIMVFEGRLLYSFPVKHNWWEKADINLIERSCNELSKFAYGDRIILLPRPGCGNGHLKWEDVRKVIEPVLPDNVVIVYK